MMRISRLWLVFPVVLSCVALVGCSEQGEQAESSTVQSDHESEQVHDHDGHSHDEHAGHDHDAHAEEPAQEVMSTVPAPAADSDREPGPLRVVVSIPTLLWPLETLLAEDDELESIIPVGESVHHLELTPEDIRLIDRADLLVLVGLGLDDAITDVVENRPSAKRIVVSLAEIAEMTGQLPDASGVADPHIWLLPDVMNVFAEQLAGELEIRYSEIGQWNDSTRARVGQEAGNAADSAAIAGLTLETRLAPFIGQGIVCNHSAFKVFLDRFELVEHAVLQPNHDVEPTAGDIKRVIDAIHEHNLKAIFVVPGHDRAAVERVAKVAGVEIIEFDPIGDGDWSKLINDWYVALYTGLTGAPPVAE